MSHGGRYYLVQYTDTVGKVSSCIVDDNLKKYTPFSSKKIRKDFVYTYKESIKEIEDSYKKHKVQYTITLINSPETVKEDFPELFI